MKKIISTLLLLSISVFVLAGCSRNNSNEAESDASQPQTETNTESSAQTDDSKNLDNPQENTEADSNMLIEPITVTGTVLEISLGENKGEGSFLVHETGGEEIRFNYDVDTIFENGPEDISLMDEVEIIYSGITTRSLPAQAYAEEIRLK